MKGKDFDNLKEGGKVDHKHYGVCTIVDYTPMFGPHLVPDTQEGKQRLKWDSGVDYPLLETSKRLINEICQ